MTAHPLYLSRARLRASRGEVLASLAPVLLPRDSNLRAGHAHRLVWLLFQDIPDSDRDFLWRDDGDGRFMILSRRRPSDPNQLFDLDTQDFAPVLAVGDRLRFALRANPVIRIDQEAKRTTTKGRQTPKRKKVDVVMHSLQHVPKTDWDRRSGRAFERERIVTESTSAWLAQQGAVHGFRIADPDKMSAANYTQVSIERGRLGRGRPAGYSVVDLEGVIEVTEPAALLTKIGDGFGSARAFGCGLMLIRRA